MDISQVLNQIKKTRREKGITQKEIAVLLFMDERTYSKIERGEKKSMDIRLLDSIAAILETDIFSILKDSCYVKPQTVEVEVEAEDIHKDLHLLRESQRELMLELRTLGEKINHYMDANP